MRRPARPVAFLIAAALTLSACGGGDDGGGEAEPTQPAASTSSGEPAPPEETPTSSGPTVPAADQVVDPCGLLEQQDYAPLVATKLREGIAEQITQNGAEMTCRAYYQIFNVMRFGFSLDPDAYDRGRVEVTPDPDSLGGLIGAEDLDDGLEDIELPGADRAFISRRTGTGVTVYAEVDGVTFFIDHGVTAFGLEQVATGSPDDVVAAATTLAANGAGQIADVPILLPDNCPAVDSAVVTDLIGTVEWGRGGANPQGISACGYAGEGDAELSASYTFLLPAYFDNEYSSADRKADVVVDPKPGVWKSWRRTGKGSYTYLARYPDYSPQLLLQLTASGIPGPSRVAGPRFAAWAETYLSANEPKGQP